MGDHLMETLEDLRPEIAARMKEKGLDLDDYYALATAYYKSMEEQELQGTGGAQGAALRRVLERLLGEDLAHRADLMLRVKSPQF